MEVIQGDGDVDAIAAGAQQFPWRAMARDSEITVEEAVTGHAIAWYPEVIDHLTTHPHVPRWAGAIKNHLCLLQLEGNETCRLDHDL
jgi:hypothetical protein